MLLSVCHLGESVRAREQASKVEAESERAIDYTSERGPFGVADAVQCHNKLTFNKIIIHI